MIAVEGVALFQHLLDEQPKEAGWHLGDTEQSDVDVSVVQHRRCQ